LSENLGVDDRFRGWPEEAQRFFIGLQIDNSKAYFESHRDTYLRCVRGPMEALLAAVQEEFGPAKIFRPNRDIRFSADKSPYKTQVAAVCEGGYVSFSASSLYAGAGWHEIDKPGLERFRAAAADDRSGAELEAIVSGLERDGYEVWGEELKLVPRPYPRDHPRARLLRHRRFVVGRSYGLQPWVGTPEALERVVAVWRAARPATEWFRVHALR